ncbi:Uncharacterised protein [Mycobacteroides abscessus subsp. abscessus]|nr:Uncharacterised protein [Mycobacteroides abscessus subsp. abscessus]
MQVVASVYESVLHVNEQVLPQCRVSACVPRMRGLVSVGGVAVPGPHDVDDDFVERRRV